MPFSSLNFLSLDKPPTLMCSPMPTSFSMPDEFEWMSTFLPTSQRTNGPVLSPAEVEEANIFVDAVLTDGDSESEAKSTNTKLEVSCQDKDFSENRKRRKNNVIATTEETVARNPTNVPGTFDLAFMEATTATEGREGLAAVPMHVAVDGMVVQGPKDLPDDWYVMGKIRKLGKTAGQMDKYYIQSKTGRKLRSMKKVRHFLETGRATMRKPRKKAGEGNSRVSDDKSKGKGPLEEGDDGEVECQMAPPESVLSIDIISSYMTKRWKVKRRTGILNFY